MSVRLTERQWRLKWAEPRHPLQERRGEERRFKKSNNHTKSPPTLYRLGRLLHVFVLLLLPVLRPIAFIMWNLSNILSFQSVHTWINDHKCCNFINTALEVLHMFARISSRLSEQMWWCGSPSQALIIYSNHHCYCSVEYGCINLAAGESFILATSEVSNWGATKTKDRSRVGSTHNNTARLMYVCTVRSAIG